MPSTFDNLFAQSGFPMLLDQFGEPVIYWARGATEGRKVRAIVNREPNAVIDPNDNLVMPTAIVQLYDSSKTGISAVELNTGGDEVEIYRHPNDSTMTRMTVMKLNSQHAGTVEIALT